MTTYGDTTGEEYERLKRSGGDSWLSPEEELGGRIDDRREAQAIGNSYGAIRGEAAQRQSVYDNLLNKLEGPGTVQRMKLGEQNILNSLQRQASGEDSGISGMLSGIENSKNNRNFAQQSARAALSGNPMAASMATQNAANNSIVGSELKNAQNVLQERLGAQQNLINSAQNIENRDYAIGSKLREDYYQQQRDAANLVSEGRNQKNQEMAQRERINAAIKQNNKSKWKKLASSDKNTKKDMKPAGTTIDIILKKIAPTEFEYKDEYKDDPRAGKGKRVGVLAQDLERAGAGFAVEEDPQNGMKMVDFGKLIPLLLAAQSHLNEKIETKEDKKTKGKK